MKRGYFGIGIENPRKEENVGTLWRSALSLGASFIFTIGNKYKRQASDTPATQRHIPLFHYLNFSDFYKSVPDGCVLIGAEITDDARDIKFFSHPEKAIYLLGSESLGLSKAAIDSCHAIVRIPGSICLNVSTCGSIILYDRLIKRGSRE